MIVLVAFVVITLIVLGYIFGVLVVLRAGSGHHRNRCCKGSSQKKRTEISVSTVHVGLLWRETHIRRIPQTLLSILEERESDQYRSGRRRIGQIRDCIVLHPGSECHLMENKKTASLT